MSSNVWAEWETPCNTICVISPTTLCLVNFLADNAALGRHTFFRPLNLFLFFFSLCEGYVLALWNPCSKLWMMYEVKSLYSGHSRKRESTVLSLRGWVFDCVLELDVLHSSCTASKSQELLTKWQGVQLYRKAERGIYWPPKVLLGTMFLHSLQAGFFL